MAMEEMSKTLRCFRENHTLESFKDDNVKTVTSIQQVAHLLVSRKKVEGTIQDIINAYQQNNILPQPTLLREQHCVYLKKGLKNISGAYECLDASRPWLCYWILHSLELLDEPVSASICSDVCKFLARCQSPTGGFAGGPGQQAHLAPTYAAVSALCIIGTQEAYNVIDREKLLDFLFSVKQSDGSFVMHVGGEVDIRSAYCAVSVASLTNIITPKLFDRTPNWIVSCQNWEGGLGGVPGLEAHGGYTFCGTAAMVILRKEHMLNLKSLLRWVAYRQMRFEGGFQGRCNKLVDGCYSFWQAGLLPLLHLALFREVPIWTLRGTVVSGDRTLSTSSWMFEQQALQEYILLCCQNPDGGLLDKPGKSRDFYHTCYCLSGLSIAQHFKNGDVHHELILGKEENRLAPTNPVYNICPEKITQALVHFNQLPVPLQSEVATSVS
ncbi:protein farnesyltransferase subunit beta-like isoform X1 [Anguilla anguilla]|uniref:protein farnesyltransferase subunit beta-like isoform X1 n=1 Tax=Anguilla anguilla TaxID=7936 RepID=UPI0015A78A6D|nr:protein farnesyltransferase subunit beta-like isoform X1 [Anguilla anguilla]